MSASIESIKALDEAVRQGDTQAVIKLLSLEKYRSSNLDDAILAAAYYGHTETVRALAQQGANVNIINNYDRCPLGQAARGGHIETIKALVELGADVNIIPEGSTPLSDAVEANQKETIKALIDLGADIHARKEYLFREAKTNEMTEFINALVYENDTSSKNLLRRVENLEASARVRGWLYFALRKTLFYAATFYLCSWRKALIFIAVLDIAIPILVMVLLLCVFKFPFENNANYKRWILKRFCWRWDSAVVAFITIMLLFLLSSFIMLDSRVVCVWMFFNILNIFHKQTTYVSNEEKTFSDTAIASIWVAGFLYLAAFVFYIFKGLA